MSSQKVTEKKEPKRTRRRRGRIRLKRLIAAGIVIGLVAVALLIDSTLYYNKVHAGVTVSGLSLGGLTHDEATAALTRYVQGAQKNPITLTSGDKKWTLSPSDVGTEIDVAQAVTTAMDVTRKSNFFVDALRRFKLYFSGSNVPLRGTVDTALMDNFLEHIAEQLDVPPVNSGLAITDGQIKVVEGRKGSVVDQVTLRGQLKSLLFTLHTTELPVPIIVKDPAVQAKSTQEALSGARTMISAPVNLTNGDTGWTLTTEEIAAYMDFTAKEQGGVSVLVPYLSADKMKPFFDQIRGKVATPGADATWASDGNKAWVVPASPGRSLDVEATAAALTAAALQTSNRTAEVAVQDSEPKLTTDEATAMGIKDRLATYTTEYVGTEDRQHNVKLTTKYAVADNLLAPGEEYNFDKHIGPRTEDRGYRLAKGITGAGKLEDVLGGGICQVSTTLFNAVFEAGLKVTERHNHTLFINHYPPGRDATVTTEGYNFRFVNDTDHYILIRGTSDGIKTTFSIYGTYDGRTVKSVFSGFTYGPKRPEVTVTNSSLGVGTTLVDIAGQSSRSCWVKRTVTYADGKSKTDTFFSEWPEYPKVTEVGVGTTTTLPGTPTTKPGKGTTAVTGF